MAGKLTTEIGKDHRKNILNNLKNDENDDDNNRS